MQPARAAFQLRKQVERAECRPGEVEITALGQRPVQVLADPRRGGARKASVMPETLSWSSPGSKPMTQLRMSAPP